MTEDVLLELPRGWAWTRLEEIVNVTSGYGFPKKYQGKVTGEIPFFKVSDISKSVLNGHMFLKVANNYISKKDCEEIRANLLRKGTIVFAKIGEAIKLNRRAILEQDSLVDNNVMGIYPYNETLDNLFAFFFLSTIKLGDYSRATTVPSVRKSDVEQISIPFPPLPEQRAIVSKIEQLFSDLDNGIENFKKAQEQLKIYRQAVLKNACEGKLVPTEAELARAEGRDYEPADVLLARILEERREKWNGRGKYKEPAVVDTSGLPAGWIWTQTGDICEGVVPGRTKPKEFKGDIPWITLPDISSFHVSKSQKNLGVTEKDAEKVGMKVMPKGSVLMSCVGQFGIICIAGCPIVPNQQFHGFVCPDIIIPEYVAYSLMTQIEQMNKLSAATTIAYINKTKCNSITIPLPPLAEQHRIVTEVERCLSICDKMEATIAESLQKAESLRQSILKKAFEGKLLNEKELEEVRSAPDWEPAEKLLERIKAEKTNMKAQKKGKK